LELRTLLVVVDSAAFVLYGVHCLRSESMKREFARYGLAQLRVMTGVLEILAGIGLIVGLWWPFALRVSSAGLALLMLFALVARIRVRDSVLLWVPALTLLFVNAWIVMHSLGVVG